MRTEIDAINSVKRYMALCLGDTWEVRLWSDEGSFAAPLAKIAASGPLTSTRRGRGITDVALPLQVFLFPVVADSVSGAMANAYRLREIIFQAIDVGLGEGWPRRIPLYDYDGLIDGQSSNVRNSYDFLKVDDLSVNTVPDSDVPQAVVVVADMRVAWSRDTTINADADTVNSVAVTTSAS
jgi:hypothetical protein